MFAKQVRGATANPTVAPARLSVKVVRVQCSLRFFSKPSSLSAPNNKYEFRRPATTDAAGSGSATLDRATDKVAPGRVAFRGMHHVGLLCKDLDAALNFYQNILGLEINPDRPHHKLPYRGAWLWIGPEMIHLMELPNPDPFDGRPEHGGRDRHTCIGVESIKPLVERLSAAGITYTMSMSGRPAVFFRDPDMNCLEVVEMEAWR
mmetsp:Transcript_34393/g.76389  ORF Transcript_34393/g.76389 Transcript_34393/m.76389 type:complete len:205 (+) Transcript_34393:132-746(+)